MEEARVKEGWRELLVSLGGKSWREDGGLGREDAGYSGSVRFGREDGRRWREDMGCSESARFKRVESGCGGLKREACGECGKRRASGG